MAPEWGVHYLCRITQSMYECVYNGTMKPSPSSQPHPLMRTGASVSTPDGVGVVTGVTGSRVGVALPDGRVLGYMPGDLAPVTPSGHRMQAQQRIIEMPDLMVYTGGEYPVSGDRSRVEFARWSAFQLPSVWRRPGVHSHRNAPMVAAMPSGPRRAPHN